MRSRVSWAIAVLVAGAGVGLAVTSSSPVPLALLLGGAAVVLAACHPTAALYLTVIAAMWPSVTLMGQPVAYGVMLASFVGIAVRQLPRLAGVRKPLLAVGGAAALMVASHLAHPTPRLVLPDEARNHLAATLLGLAVLASVIMLRPDPRRLLAVLALSSASASVYLLATGAATESGRFETLALNENATGHVGALAAVCSLAAWRWSGHVRWLAVAVGPLWLVVLSQSRGAAVVLAAALGAAFVFRRTGAPRYGVAIAIPALLWVSWPLLLRVMSTFLSRRAPVDIESDIRLRALELAGDLAVSNPLLGVGWRRFPDFSASRLGLPLNTHNEYARVAAESGLLALGLLLFVLLLAYRAPALGLVKAAMTGGVVSLAFANTMSSTLIAVPVWVLVGLALAARTPAGRHVETPTKVAQAGK